jgi:hypothetical protein
MKYILFEKIARSPLGSWFFAVQIGRKHRFANRAKGGPKNKEVALLNLFLILF